MILLGVNIYNAETNILGKEEMAIQYSNETFQPPVLSMLRMPIPINV
jgi:hypothetical protein